MGATSSIAAKRICFTETECRSFMGGLFDRSFHAHADPNHTIRLHALQCMHEDKVDVYLSFDWTQKSSQIVLQVADALQAEGYKVHFNGAADGILSGISSAFCIVLFLSKRYMKAANDPASTVACNPCAWEFEHVTASGKRIITVVIDPRMLEPDKWDGRVSRALKGSIAINFCTDDAVDVKLAALSDTIMEVNGGKMSSVMQHPLLAELIRNKAESVSADDDDSDSDRLADLAAWFRTTLSLSFDEAHLVANSCWDAGIQTTEMLRHIVAGNPRLLNTLGILSDQQISVLTDVRVESNDDLYDDSLTIKPAVLAQSLSEKVQSAVDDSCWLLTDELKGMGFQVKQLLSMGFSIHQLRESGLFVLKDFLLAGCSNEELVLAGYTNEEIVQELRQQGYSVSECLKIGFKPSQLKNSYNTLDFLRARCKLHDVYSPPEEHAALEDLVDIGMSLHELLKYGISLQTLRQYPELFPLKTLLSTAACQAQDLHEAGWSGMEIATVFRELGKSLPYCVEQSMPLRVLRKVYPLEDFLEREFSLQQLYDAGFSVEQLLPSFTAHQLRDVGFMADVLIAAGSAPREVFTAAEMRAIGQSLPQLKALGYAPKELQEAGYTLEELSTVSISMQDVRSAGVVLVNQIKRQCVLAGHTDQVICLAVCGKLLASGGSDHSIIVWDLSVGGKQVQVLDGHSGSVLCLCFLKQGKQLMSGSADRSLKLWSMSSGDCMSCFFGHQLSVCCLAVESAGKWIISGSWDSTLRLWDITSGKCKSVFHGHTGCVRGVAICRQQAGSVWWRGHDIEGLEPSLR